MDTEEIRKAVLGHIQGIALAKATDFLEIKNGSLEIKDTGNLPPELGAALSSVERTSTGLKLKFYDKLKALELLGKLLGMFDNPVAPNRENALLQAILQSTKEAVDTGDIPEIQQTADTGDDLVESAGS